jgi:hypothetical protein
VVRGPATMAAVLGFPWGGPPRLVGLDVTLRAQLGPAVCQRLNESSSAAR